jgi:glycosyltransferase involved in cell wall biosynthesis
MRSGFRAPDFELRDLEGGYRSLSDWRGRRVLLIFVQPGCPYSRSVLDVVAGLHPDPPAGVPAPVVITFGEEAENLRLRDTHRLRCPVLLQGDATVARAYLAEETPAGCLIDEDGRVVDTTRVGAVSVLTQTGVMPAPQWTWSTTPFRQGDYWYDQLVAPRVQEASAAPTTGAKDDLPLVSVVMTTRDRPGLLPIALECYRSQAYRRRELIVVDDGSRFPVDEAAVVALGGRLIRVPEGTPLGIKLNRGVREARGELCQKWDDDDWYAPGFLDALVGGYLDFNARVCRPTVAFQARRHWFDLARWRVIVWPSPDVAGGTLLFTRQDWERHPFREIRRCVDLWFLVDQVNAGVTPTVIDAPETHAYVRHDVAGTELGHTWARWLSGDPMEDYLQALPAEGTDPAQLFPEWALSAYAALSGNVARDSVPASHRSATWHRTPDTVVEKGGDGAPTPSRERSPALQSDDQYASKPNLLYLAAEIPDVLGGDTRARAGVLLEALAEHYDVYLIVVLRQGRPDSWIPARTSRLCRNWAVVQPPPGESDAAGVEDTFRRAAEVFHGVPFAVIHSSDLSMSPLAEAYLDAAGTPARHVDLACVDSVVQREVAACHREHEREELAAEADREAAEMAAAEARLLPRCDRVSVSSSRDRRRLQERYNLTNVVVLPNAVRAPLPLPPRPPKDALSFLFVVTFGRYPSEDAATFLCKDILHELRQTSPGPFELTIVARGRFPPAVARFGRLEEVNVVPATRRMEPWYHQADVVLAPWRIGAGTQLAVLEAMSYRRPVVSTSIAVQDLDVIGGEHVLIGDTAEAFAEGCVRLIADPQLANRVTDGAYELCIRSYSPNVLRAAVAGSLDPSQARAVAAYTAGG